MPNKKEYKKYLQWFVLLVAAGVVFLGGFLVTQLPFFCTFTGVADYSTVRSVRDISSERREFTLSNNSDLGQEQSIAFAIDVHQGSEVEINLGDHLRIKNYELGNFGYLIDFYFVPYEEYDDYGFFHQQYSNRPNVQSEDLALNDVTVKRVKLFKDSVPKLASLIYVFDLEDQHQDMAFVARADVQSFSDGLLTTSCGSQRRRLKNVAIMDAVIGSIEIN